VAKYTKTFLNAVTVAIGFVSIPIPNQAAPNPAIALKRPLILSPRVASSFNKSYNPSIVLLMENFAQPAINLKTLCMVFKIDTTLS